MAVGIHSFSLIKSFECPSHRLKVVVDNIPISKYFNLVFSFFLLDSLSQRGIQCVKAECGQDTGCIGSIEHVHYSMYWSLLEIVHS